MIFYFTDKNDFERRIIDDVLTEHGIKHKIIVNHIPMDCEYGEEEEEEYTEIYIVSFDIKVDTTLEMFDYIKWLVDKRITTVVKLNRCYKKRAKNRKKDKDEIGISK